MASRNFTSQFAYSFERQQVELMGNYTQTDLGAFAALVTQGITLTANTIGAAGNSITLTITAGATAGAEVITVSGTAITAQIESGVSTITQVRTALNLSAPAAVLMTATGTSGSAVIAATVLPLAGGDDTDFTVVGGTSMTLTQTGTGLYKITLMDSYPNLIGASITLQRATAVDLNSQLIAVDTQTAKTITFRMVAGATPTNMANSDVLYIMIKLRNSSN